MVPDTKFTKIRKKQTEECVCVSVFLVHDSRTTKL